MANYKVKILFSLATSLALCTSAVYAQVDEDVFAGQYVAQQKLNKLGYDVGKPDGVIGSKTLTAIKVDAEKNGYEASTWGFQEYYIGKTVEGSKPFENEEIKEKIKEAIGDNLLDPYSAVYEDWRILPSGAVCVDVNAKNAYGAYVGKQPTYIPLIFGFPGPIASSQHLNSWRCYLDPESN